jgi:hypothetical protein
MLIFKRLAIALQIHRYSYLQTSTMEKTPSQTKIVEGKTFTLLLQVKFGEDKTEADRTKSAQAEHLLEYLEAAAEKKGQQSLTERVGDIVEFWVCLE